MVSPPARRTGASAGVLTQSGTVRWNVGKSKRKVLVKEKVPWSMRLKES